MQRFQDHLIPTQREHVPGTVANNGGGYSFAVDKWKQLDRFLVLGTEGGTYYVGERKLTRDNAKAVADCLAEDPARTVARIVAISQGGRAPKNDPALFALAMALVAGVPQARAAIPDVARIGTHLFHLVEYYKALGGKWGRANRTAFGRWYMDRPAGALAYQAIKYQQRDGWSHRDLLRLTHPKLAETHQGVANWIVKGWEGVGVEPHPDEVLRKIWAFERAKVADTKELINLIVDHNLPHECVPNEAKGNPAVWAAMLPHMALGALVRNLGKMTSVGLLKPLSAATKTVTERLGDVEEIRRARLHPVAILVALKTYSGGRGIKGVLSWSPVSQVTAALDAAFYGAFKAVEPTGKRTMLCLDVSGSMEGASIAGMPMTAREASAAMSLVTANVEAQHMCVAFSGGLATLDINPRSKIMDFARDIGRLPFSSTDCSLPFKYAKQAKLDVDSFIVYTDSETNSNSVHPARALRDYRQASGVNAKLTVVAMASSGFTIADPNDAGMLDVVGFDAAAPSVIADFMRD